MNLREMLYEHKYKIIGRDVASALDDAGIPPSLLIGGLAEVGLRYANLQVTENKIGDIKFELADVLETTQTTEVLAEEVKQAVAKATIGKSFDEIIAALYQTTIDMVEMRDKAEEEEEESSESSHNCSNCGKCGRAKEDGMPDDERQDIADEILSTLAKLAETLTNKR